MKSTYNPGVTVEHIDITNFTNVETARAESESEYSWKKFTRFDQILGNIKQDLNEFDTAYFEKFIELLKIDAEKQG